LDQVLPRIPRVFDSNVLVGFDTADDAGVYKLTPECALVQTLDFFTPIVDDPYLFGAVAAANSLSDVYAMGGRPLTSLSILCYPSQGDLDDLEQILRGGADKMAEAGCILLGGHSVADDEMKFGYAITGTVHPDRVLANAGARPGDALLLTKPIGTGVISTALKRGIAAESHMQAAIESMTRLNRAAAEPLAEANAHGCTDITGFGLVGHAREMAIASKVTLEIDARQIEFLPGALDYARAGALPAGLKNNREFASCAIDLPPEIPPEVESLLYDPQTSGGLLISLPEAGVARIGVGRRIGRVREKGDKPIQILW
jgi:selenide, water dikinase